MKIVDPALPQVKIAVPRQLCTPSSAKSMACGNAGAAGSLRSPIPDLEFDLFGIMAAIGVVVVRHRKETPLSRFPI
jgi:hypothetical protein